MTDEYRHERYAVHEGYAVGTTVGGQWLTILGSHWETIPLFPTVETAEAWFRERWAQNPPGDWYEPITRKVERCGQYYRIVNSPPADAETVETHGGASLPPS